ncbi:unnamed protein product [Peniophora sp. CBMAI 1063]|nr:unnamed protein product [Peniophora sp. CBMAI 1063]
MSGPQSSVGSPTTPTGSPSSQSKGVKREATAEDIEEVSAPRPKKPRNSSLQYLTLDDEPDRDPTFWYSDGSVVLSVAETLFKLHRSRLASQSTYLQDLFEGAPDEDFEADGNTCPLYVIRVKGLKLFDFSSLLSMVEDPFSARRNTPSFALIAAVARAAKLLGFDQALTWATGRLEETWPVEVADIERGSRDHAQEALELSRILDMPTIRKRALYELMRLPGFGQDGEDSALSISDYRLLTHAREKCSLHWTGIMKKGPTKLATKCAPLLQGCPVRHDGTRLNKWWTLMAKEDMMWRYYLDPIGGYRQLKTLLFREAKADPMEWCPDCQKEWEKEWTTAQENLWKDLDEWLELPQ